MKILLIYTPQHGEYLKTILDATVSLLRQETFQSAIEIIMPLAVCIVGYQYVVGKKIAALQRYVLTSFLVTVCLLGLRVPVGIIDMQTARGAGSALNVDNVPMGIALPAAIISGMGYGITQLFSDVFHMPDDLDYNKTGMIFGARTWLAATNTRLSLSPDVATDISSYIRQCVFAAKLLGSQEIRAEDLVNSPDLMKTYFEKPSPIYRVIFQDGQNLGCIDAAAKLKTRLPGAAKRELDRLDQLMGGNGSTASKSLEAIHNEYKMIAKGAAAILTQNILINATRDATADAFSFSGADAALMNYTNTSSMQKMHVAEANSFWLASFRLPYYMTVMWMLTICIFPLVVLLSFLPLTQNVYVFYLQSQAYLWSWPPMFIIIHFFVSLASAHTINLFGQQTGGVTFSNIDSLASMHSTFAYTAGALAASVPFLAYYITKGLSSVLSNASQHFGGMVQSMSVGEAQTAAQGNVSMASYSGWNMNYDNTNAHKFDTNAYHAEGRKTLQMANGAQLSQNADGSRVGNVAQAISTAPVSVNGSHRVIDALHQSANESFGRANQYRTAADSHIQGALNEMKNFTEQDANDYRHTEGVSNTTTASIGQDLRIMKDSIQHYNDHKDKTTQISYDAAIRGSANSSRSLFGKGVKWAFGGSAELSGTHSRGTANHTSIQDFFNTSDGKSFADAYHHMIATAKHSNLDSADSHHLSGVEQIAANFSSGESLLQQSSTEHSRGLQLQQAASHAIEEASSIDANLSQPFHNWVFDRFGAKGEAIMLQTDASSISTQRAWANEFLKSTVGQQAISKEVKHALARTEGGIKRDYETDASKLSASSHVRSQYLKDSHQVDDKASSRGLSEMSSEYLQSAQLMQQNHRLTPIVNEGDQLKASVVNTILQTELKQKREK